MNTPREDNPTADDGSRDDLTAQGQALPDELRWALRELRRDEPPQHDLWPGIALRWKLRGLCRDEPPQHDLWPGIARRLASVPRQPPAPSQAWRRFAPLAMAASLALAIGLAWQLRPPVKGADPGAQLISAEADAMTLEYQAALREFGQATPAAAESTVLHELDRSAAQIRTAMARDPGARFLLDRLQDTYARRLALTQRLALS
jgi:hypothetical protein